MARRTNLGELVHCDACGEDYSATYKRCPFCGARPGSREPAPQQTDGDDDDNYIFDGQDAFDDEPEVFAPPPRAKGGKRLAGSSQSGRRTSGGSSRGHGTPPPPINWPRLITFLCSLVIIVAALVIVFTVVYPQLRQDPAPSGSKDVTASSAPSSAPASTPVSDPSAPVDPSASIPAGSGTLNGLSFGRANDYDFTLPADGSHTITLVFDPVDWEGEVIWSSSDANYATVDATGTVKNVNTTSSLRRAIITVTADGQTASAVVYCRPSGTSASAPPVVTPTPAPAVSEAPVITPPPSGGLTIGHRGTITNASGGLRVRSGPGTSYGVVGSLFNGNTVTVEADAGDGWYEISFSGSGGARTTGYIMGDYIAQ